MAEDNESVYAKLVENKSDILGIIAYSLYKRQKIEYLSNIKDMEGRDATQEELKSFLSLANSPIQLEFYKDQAAELGSIFVDEMLSEHIEYAHKCLICMMVHWHCVKFGTRLGTQFFNAYIIHHALA